MKSGSGISTPRPDRGLERSRMYLSYEDLTVRDARPGDAEQLAAWWNDGRVMAHAGFPNGLGTTALSVMELLASDQACHRLMIEIGGRAAGEMCWRDKGNGAAEIGIKICDISQQNKGCGKKLLSLLIRALFRELGYTRILLDTNLDNRRAQHVYEELGFQKLRVNENSWTDQLGNLQSSVDYELTQPDFHSFLPDLQESRRPLS